MKFPLPLLIPLIVLSMVISSCGEKSPQKKEAKEQEQVDFFAGATPSLQIETLENELGDGETDFLRSFAKDNIAWQKWNKSLLEKASKAQLPVFAFVGSPIGATSREVAQEIDESEELRKVVSNEAICSVVDIRIHPEIADLSYHLAGEVNRPTSFPMIIWLSPEGSPLAWIPVGPAHDRELEKVIKSAAAMVHDIWQNSSRYAVENSRRDNEARQLRLNYETSDNTIEPETKRNTVFGKSTRQLSALYSPGEKDLDHIGGLLPINSLQLLAIGAQSKLLTDEVRDRCRTAAREVAEQLMNGALRDPLDQFYFYARKTNDWSLPAFSKDLESQARVASLFLNLGRVLDEPKFTTEGQNLLKRTESKWLGRNVTILSSLKDKKSPDTFLWSFAALKEILTEEEMKLATGAFSLEKEGNIPLGVDPLGDYYQLNSLRNQTSAAELATLTGETEASVNSKLEEIRQKLLAHRIQEGDLISESAITIIDLLMVLKAQIERSVITGSETDLERALKTADQIIGDYWSPEKGLMRHLGNTSNIPARARDYAAASLILTLVYQRTLDPKWLIPAIAIMDRAIADLVGENGLLEETPNNERVIPLSQYNVSMIFGTSTLGFADEAATRLYALTGNPTYRTLAERHSQVIGIQNQKSVVNHTDFLQSCALGDTPLVAVIQGPVNSAAARELLSVLNSPSYLPFLSIRPASDSIAGLRPLPALPVPEGANAVTLLLGEETLGQASSPAGLTTLLDSVISTRE